MNTKSSAIPAALTVCFFLFSNASSRGAQVSPSPAAEVYQNLQQLPVEWRIMEAPVFETPIVPVADPRGFAAENADLWAALESMYREGPATGLLAIEAFLEAYPDSVWMPSLRNVLATHYERTGRYSLALQHWEEVWAATEGAPTGELRHQADLALAHWSRLLCGLGEIGRLHVLMPAIRLRRSEDVQVDWTLREVETRYGGLLTRPPGIVNCGTMAMAQVLREPQRAEFLLQALVLNKAPAEGFTLAQLVEIAREAQIQGTVIATQAEGAVPTPCVAHFKVGHFVAITGQLNGRYRVEDAGLRRGLWMDASDLWGELSGYFMILNRTAPQGFRVVPSAEAAEVYGRGLGSEVDEGSDDGGECSSAEAGDDSGCSTPGCVPTGTWGSTGGGSSANPNAKGIWAGPCADCGSKSKQGTRDRAIMDRVVSHVGEVKKPQGAPAGMPVWSVSEPYLNVWLSDTPMRYPRADGSWQEFTLRYKQRNPRTDSWGWGFGPNWEGDRLTYMERHTTGTWDVQMYLPGGGMRRYPDPSYYAPEDSYEYRTRSRLEYTYDGQSQVNGIRVLWPNGAISTYGYRYVIWSGYERYFLTQQADPAGRTTTYTYQLASSRVHLTSLQDRDGLTTSFEYTNGSYPHQVTAMTNATYSLRVQLTYDGSGRLTNLLDTAGIASRFVYLGNGWITNLVTPYGTTVFRMTGTSSTFASAPPWTFNRSALITEPDGISKHLFVYRDGGDPDPDPLNLLPNLDANGGWPVADWPRKPAEDGGFPDEWWGWTLDGLRWMQHRNTHYWNPQQYANLNANFRNSNGDLSLLVTADFTFARMRHWLHNNDPFGYVYLGLSTTLSMERDPSPDGSVDGQTTWYDHADKATRGIEWEGLISPWPTLMARVMPDGTAWGVQFTRNASGNVTEQIEYWKSPTDQDRYRTNRFVYAANGVDLITHYGPGEEFETGYAYDPAHPHLPVAVTNALGEVTRYYYDTALNRHRLLGVAFPSGLATTNTYSSGWLQTTKQFLGTTPLSTNSFTWLKGYLRTLNDPRNLTQTFTRDTLGRLTRVDYSSDSTYETFSYVRPSDSKQILEVTAHLNRLGKTNLYTYTPLRQLETFTDTLGRITRYTYCGCGGPDSVTSAYGTSLAPDLLTWRSCFA